MKNIKILCGVFICLCLSVSSIFAIENNYYDEMCNWIIGYVDEYRKIGVTSSQIANIMNSTYKTDTQTYNYVLNERLLDKEELVNGVEPRVSIDGNPPENDAEANERFHYIRNVLANEYSDDKYKDKQGKYFGYLYASHYIENTAYDKNNPNFDNIMANIICEEDIKAFDKFYSYTTEATVLDCFVKMQNAYNIFTNEEEIIKTATRDAVVNAINKSKTKASSILEELDKCGIVDKNDQVSTLQSLYDNYMLYADSAKTEEDMINQMYENIGNKELSLTLVSSYVNAFWGIATLSTVTSFVIPVIAGICYFTDTLSKALSLVALGQLYYSGQARRADRLSIKLGLFPRP